MRQPLTFGIYPGGMAGGDQGLLTGSPDDLPRARAALGELQGSAAPFVVRCYDSFQDPGSPLWAAPSAPPRFAGYADPPDRPMDLVLQYRSAAGNISGYLDFVRDRIRQFAHLLYSVQITEEPNSIGGPNVIDGSYPNVCEALVAGVQAAKECLDSLGRRQVKVGFNSTPTFGPGAGFWTTLAAAPPAFRAALDYVGLDFFPDVFRPLPADGQRGDLVSAVAGILETMRTAWLPAAGIPHRVPIHIAEHGWPTSAGRSAERQAQVIEGVIRTVDAHRERLHIERYSLFALRDVDLPNPGNQNDPFHFFGIMTAAYERKPAFEVFRRLIQELGN